MIEISIKQILRICFILTILSIGKVLAFNGQGQGTPESPYLISTADQLKEIKDDMDVHYKLVNDIEITTQWSYIGSSLLAFTGTLDGNYNQITLNIQNKYLQPIITQYFIDNKSEIWLLFLIAHSKR